MDNGVQELFKQKYNCCWFQGTKCCKRLILRFIFTLIQKRWFGYRSQTKKTPTLKSVSICFIDIP